MAIKSMKIAAENGMIIPGSILGLKEDKHFGPHEEVSVPVAYGEHLIHDRFAYEVKGRRTQSAD